MKKALKLFLATICMFIMIYPSTAAHAEETNIVNIPLMQILKPILMVCSSKQVMHQLLKHK